MPQVPTGTLQFAVIPTNGVRLHVAQAGPADGPLVVLLHGFPEFWYGWRSQIPALGPGGFSGLGSGPKGLQPQRQSPDEFGTTGWKPWPPTSPA